MSAGPGLLAAAVGVLAVVVVLLAVVVVRQGRALRRLGQAPVVAEHPVSAAPPDEGHLDVTEAKTTSEPEYVITQVGDSDLPAEHVPDRLVLSVALGEPLVKAVALGHGVRRAMSGESRNRIWFHVRREVKRSRKVRRREMREVWRRVQAERAQAAQAAQAAGAPDHRDVA